MAGGRGRLRLDEDETGLLLPLERAPYFEAPSAQIDV
jgi:hypothetical protein